MRAAAAGLRMIEEKRGRTAFSIEADALEAGISGRPGDAGQAKGMEPVREAPIVPTSRRQMRGWHYHYRLAQMPPDGDWRV